MERIIQQTEDGSQTIAIPDMQVIYHSRHGAIQESLHVFINAGLKPISGTKETVHIFEMGFGTGLNALLTLQHTILAHQKIYYKTIELFPLEDVIYTQLNYAAQLSDESLQFYFNSMHNCAWEKDELIQPLFTLNKSKTSLTDFSTDQLFDLIYFDAFDPAAQPELWAPQVFEKMFHMLLPGGLLVTYSSKGTVRRAMQAAGFTVEKLKGPAGKREMIRAKKNPA
jgi:tRNA U34 5-methylaminomethyl-2-thiouridine-forming methyltransferase MnmC